MRRQFEFEAGPYDAEYFVESLDGAYETEDFPTRLHDRHIAANLNEVIDDEISRLALGSADAVQGFIGSEHRDIGDLASGRKQTTILYGERGQRLSFGEVVALAGDCFATYEEMRDLASTPTGRARIAWARWDALDLKHALDPKDRVEPKVPEAVKTAVRNRNNQLAGGNLSHFSERNAALNAYTKGHSMAIPDAFEAGKKGNEEVWRRALTKEAFGLHFLTDMFSAGHVRMPRTSIEEWYKRYMPGSIDRIVGYMAKFIYNRLAMQDSLPLPKWIPWFQSWFTQLRIRKVTHDLGGEAIRTFSLGDIVSLALHDLDNKGLEVISEVDPNGKKNPGGFRWTAVGDSHLEGRVAKSTPCLPQKCISKAYAPGHTTKMMAIAAVKSSLRELERVREVGRKLAASRLSPSQEHDAIRQALGWPLFAATEAFVPKEDRTSRNNVPLPGTTRGASRLEWRWGRLGDIAYKAVDDTVKCRIAKELCELLPKIPDPAHVKFPKTDRTIFKIPGTRRAFRSFVDHLRREGIRVLEKAVEKKAR